MPAVRAQVTIPTVSGGPADVSMNVWYFRPPSTSSTDLGAVTAALAAFYNAVKNMYPASMNFAAAGVKYYRMSDPKPRPPIGESLLGTTGTGVGTSGPSEIALCLSFHGTKVAGQNFARQRGRVYIGPLTVGLIGVPAPAPATITQLVGAGQSLLDLSNNNAWKWIIWSERQNEDPQAGVFPDVLVIGGWVDNAWDTQRRRGITPTSRSLYGSPAATLMPAAEFAEAQELEVRDHVA